MNSLLAFFFLLTVLPKELSKEVENPPSHILLPSLIPSVEKCQVSQYFVSISLLVGYICPNSYSVFGQKKVCSLGWERFQGPLAWE